MDMEEFILFENESNNSFCYEDINYCVESTIYRKVLGSIIFVLVWPFIVLDIKKFPLGRPAAALVGATLMVVFVVVPQKQVYIILGDQGNLQTLFLLIGMMLLSYYYDREGMLNYISLYIFGKNKAFKHVLWKVCVLSAVLSAIITNDATCVVLTPLLLAEHTKQDRSKKEYAPLLLGIATSANIGSASTFFGNPQNAFIAANGDVSLLIFFLTTLPAAVVGIAISVAILYLCYFRTVWPKKTLATDEPADIRPKEDITVANEIAAGPITNEVAHLSLADSRRELALSYDQSDDPQETSQIAKQYNELYTSMQMEVDSDNPDNTNAANDVITVPSFRAYGATSSVSHHRERRSRNSNKSQSAKITSIQEEAVDSPGTPVTEDQMPPKSRCQIWRKRVFVTWLIVVTGIVILLLAIPPRPVVSAEFNLGLVPVGAAVATMLVDTLLNKKYAFDAMIKVDWTMILMFMGLFVWLGGFQNTLFPNFALDAVLRYMDLNTVQGVLFFTAFISVGSNLLSNVPLVILVVEQLSEFQCGEKMCTSQLTGVLLAWISTVAGNFTLIGSIANLIVAEKARNATGYRLGFFVYLKFGLCSTIIVLLAGLPIVYFTGDHLHINVGTS